jgi:hypothetical protein
MADRVWIGPRDQPQSKGFRLRLERQDGNLVAADSLDVEIFIGDDATSALLREHRTFRANKQRADDEVIKVAAAYCMVLNISLENMFIANDGNPRQSSTRFGGLHLKRQTTKELLDAPCEIRREVSELQVFRLGQPLQLDDLLKHYEVSFARSGDPILVALADRLALVQAIQNGQIATIFMEVNTIDDTWKCGPMGTQLFGDGGHFDGQIVSAWCQIDGKIVSLGRVAAYHVTSACSPAKDYRVCGDEELFGLLHEDPVLKDMFAGLVSWILAHESKENQDMIIWPGNARFAADIGRELSEAECACMPSEILRLQETVKSKLRCLDIDGRQTLQTQAQAVVHGKMVQWLFLGRKARQQCGPRWKVLAELIENERRCIAQGC